MSWKTCLGLGLIAAFWISAAHAQEAPNGEGGGADPQPPGNTGLEPESLPAELAEDDFIAPPPFRMGPTPVSDVQIL